MPPDYTGWPTKRQAADQIGVSTKWVEQMEADGRLEAGLYKRPGGGNRIKVYNPGDVERLAAARRQEAGAFVVPAGESQLPNPQSQIPAGDAAQLVQVLAWFQRLLELAGSGKLLGTFPERTGTGAQSVEPVYIDLVEAAALAGLSERTLRALIRAGELEARKDPPRGGVWKVRRRDILEGL